MKTLIKIEEGFIFLFSVFLFGQLDFAWWWYPLLLFTPDLSILGYLFNPKIGAMTYNFIHHKGVGFGIYVLGIMLGLPVLQLTGVILFGHSSMDRVFGYGLKYPDSFQHTHLGMMAGGRTGSGL
jgi:hypothetical protein